jgi:metal-sulfur cluster biosynthetic enzyme
METKQIVIENLKQVFDPEMDSLNVYDLGLIYNIDVDADNGWITITHTLTSAFCPFADSIVEDITAAGYKNTDANHVEVITTFDPPFTMESVPEETRLMMGW